MEYYNPVQNRSATGAPINYAAPPGSNPALSYSQPSPMANQKDRYGTMTQIGGLRDPATTTGATFQANSKIAALEALKNTMSTANPEDYAGMDEMRNYYRNALGDLPGQTADSVSSFNTQAQRGLTGNLAVLRNANAGRGTMGSRQYAGAQGDLASRANSDYMTGLIKARSDALDQAGKIGTGLSGVQNTNLLERKFQTDQGQSLADLITNFMAQDQGREAGLSAAQAQKDAANKAMWGQIVSGAAMAGGTALAGPAGGAAAGAAASGAVK